MLHKDQITIGQRVKWQPVGTREQRIYGTVIGIHEDEVLVQWDDGGTDANTFIPVSSAALSVIE